MSQSGYPHLRQSSPVVPPSVSAIERAGGASATVQHSASSVDYTVTFSASVTGVDASDFTLTGSDTASGNITSVSGSGSTYTITVDTLGGDGSLRLDLNSSGTGIQNGASMAITGGYTSGETYVLDHTAPAAPANFALLTYNDSGASSSDGVTNWSDPVVTGTAEANATVTLYDSDGTTVLGSTTADGSGNWSLDSNKFSDGSYTVIAKATDAAGNVSSGSSLSFDIDSAAPANFAISSSQVSLASAFSGANIQTLSAQDDHSVSYTLTAGSSGNDASNGSFTISGNHLVASSTLSAGTYHVHLSATDLAGNVTQQAFTFDVVDSPDVASIVRANSAVSLVQAATASIDYTVTFTQPVTGVDASDFTVSGSGTASGSISAVTPVSGDTYTITVSSLAGNGSLRVNLNSSGTGIQNGSSVAISGGFASGQSYVLDHTAPSTPAAPVVITANDSGSYHNDGITNYTDPIFSGTAEANSTVKLYDGSTLLGTATAANGSGNWTIDPGTLSEGSHLITVKATDAAGNVSAASSATTVVIDTSASAPPTPVLSPGSDSGTAGDHSTNVTTPVITGTAEAGATVTLYDSNNSVLGTATANGSGAWSITSSTLSVGQHDLTVQQTDLAGNTSAHSTALTLTIEAPSAPPPPPPALPPPTTIDGVQVQQQPVLLPDGSSGTQLTIPIVGSNRVDTSGSGSLADIPLANSNNGGAPLLLAQLSPGVGLVAVDSGVISTGSASQQLAQSILSTPTMSSAEAQSIVAIVKDQLLTQYATNLILLQNIVPQVDPATGQADPVNLTMSGSGDLQTKVALVIDATHAAAALSLVLNQVSLAAVSGAANITCVSPDMLVVSDKEIQNYILTVNDKLKIYAGGGDDQFHVNTGAAQGDAHSGRVSGAADPATTLLQGGSGNDTVTFSGASSDYTVEQHDGYLVVTAKAQPTQHTLLVNVEQLQFSDTSVAVQNRAELSTIDGLYQSILGRQADYSGMDFWGTQQKNGLSLGQIALNLMQSAEAQALHHYSFTGNAVHDVEVLYEAIFNRAADSAGQAFWAGQIAHGMTLAQVAQYLVTAPEMDLHKIGVQAWDFHL